MGGFSDFLRISLNSLEDAQSMPEDALVRISVKQTSSSIPVIPVHSVVNL